MKNLESKLSTFAGVEIEITIISEKKFSFFWDGENKHAESKLRKLFKTQGTFDKEEVYNTEDNWSCLYLNLN